MTIIEAMEKRHTVRKYQDKKIPVEVVEKLNQRIKDLNMEHNTNMSLVTENTEAFNFMIKLILAKGVKNYLILAAKEGSDEALGYCSTDIMLYAQTLGLNSWWVGGTFSRGKVADNANLKANEKVIGIIALGYGTEQGKPHKSKAASEVSIYKGDAPAWFDNGVKAALLAPTALNHQKFMITGEESRVQITCDNGIFTSADL